VEFKNLNSNELGIKKKAEKKENYPQTIPWVDSSASGPPFLDRAAQSHVHRRTLTLDSGRWRVGPPWWVVLLSAPCS
jgi:hypothetical protein